MNYTSPTFASSLANILPAMTFIMAAIFRLEKVDIKKIPSQAKIIGTIVAIGGAVLMVFYEGPVIGNTHLTVTAAAHNSDKKYWLLGTLFLMGSVFAWTSFFILQSYTLKEYPSVLSLTACVCSMGTLETGIVSVVMVRNLKDWALGWDSRLLAVVYTGVVCSGIAYFLLSVVNRERGPVFVTVFIPLCTIITTALGYILFHELLHLGRVVGALIIMLGLYAVAWGKSKEIASTATTRMIKSQGLPVICPTTTETIVNDTTNRANT